MTPSPGHSAMGGASGPLTSRRERRGRRRRTAEDARAAEAGGPAGNMLPERGRRRTGLERFLMRLIATGGIIGIGVAIGAIMVSSAVAGWITGLVVAAVSVLLSAILWSSRQL